MNKSAPDRGGAPHEHHETLAEHGPRRWWRAAIEEHARDVDVLDLGCGRGRDLRYLLERGGARSATGVDLSVERSERAKRRAPKADLSIADAERLPFDDGTFDTVLCSGTLHHLPNWADRGLPEIARVLRPDGVLVLNEGMMLLDPLFRVYRSVVDGARHAGVERPLPPRKLERRLRELFDTVDYSGHYYLSPLFPEIDRRTPLPVPERLATACYDLEYRLCNPRLRHFGGRVNVVAEGPIGRHGE